MDNSLRSCPQTRRPSADRGLPYQRPGQERRKSTNGSSVSKWLKDIDISRRSPRPSGDVEITNTAGPADSRVCTVSLTFTVAGQTGTPVAGQAPPAFFPLQRVTFSPSLRVHQQRGLKLGSALREVPSTLELGEVEEEPEAIEEISSMLLGVSGVLESLKDGVVEHRRVVADFCTDLTAGLAIWRRDASASMRARQRAVRGDRLPAGTYVLPLSMRIPCSDRLPPSFESTHFRLRYSITLALVATAKPGSSTGSVIVRTSTPFHVLPSTLPSLPPRLPTLQHDDRSGMFASAASAFGLISSSEHTYRITPRLATSHYTPGGVIPVELQVVPPPGVGGLNQPGQDIFIRLSVIRRCYHRVSSSPLGLTAPADDPWAFIPPPDELSVIKPYCVEEIEIPGTVSWCALASTELRQANGEALRRLGVAIPLSRLPSGYSLTLDLAAGQKPAGDGGSWFREANGLPREREIELRTAGQHVFASTRFFVAMEFGYASAGSLASIYSNGRFSTPGSPCPFAGSVIAQPTGSQTMRLPQKLREYLVPITIGSVAEPAMSCLEQRRADPVNTPTSQRIPSGLPPTGMPLLHTGDEAEARNRASAALREEISETRIERAERIGTDGEEPWLVPCPSFEASLAQPPAYVLE